MCPPRWVSRATILPGDTHPPCPLPRNTEFRTYQRGPSPPLIGGPLSPAPSSPCTADPVCRGGSLQGDLQRRSPWTPRTAWHGVSPHRDHGLAVKRESRKDVHRRAIALFPRFT